MDTKNIEHLIVTDLEKLLSQKHSTKNIKLDTAIETAAYVAAKYLRIIFANNKEIKTEELNGIFGIISNFYNEIFQNQLNTNDYQAISTTALQLLKDVDFDTNCEKFFKNIMQ